ncbi:MAG: cytochrome c [Saprospiraceae bacterium]|nr:cytochrome c [Saprospiraceae bacterium]
MRNIFLFQRYGFTLRIPLLFFCLMVLGTHYSMTFGQTTWKAPFNTNNLKNPYLEDADAASAGKALYKQFCAICHGDRGKGDGLAGMTLKPRPATFTKSEIELQTD